MFPSDDIRGLGSVVSTLLYTCPCEESCDRAWAGVKQRRTCLNPLRTLAYGALGFLIQPVGVPTDVMENHTKCKPTRRSRAKETLEGDNIFFTKTYSSSERPSLEWIFIRPETRGPRSSERIGVKINLKILIRYPHLSIFVATPLGWDFVIIHTSG